MPRQSNLLTSLSPQIILPFLFPRRRWLHHLFSCPSSFSAYLLGRLWPLLFLLPSNTPLLAPSVPNILTSRSWPSSPSLLPVCDLAHRRPHASLSPFCLAALIFSFLGAYILALGGAARASHIVGGLSRTSGHLLDSFPFTEICRPLFHRPYPIAPCYRSLSVPLSLR